MKYILSLLFITLLFACEKKNTEYINKENLFAFHKGDTLIYKSNLLVDSFVVEDIDISMFTTDKRVTKEEQNIAISELSKECREKPNYHYNYCSFQIWKAANSIDAHNFRNMVDGLHSVATSYTLANNISLKVYKRNSDLCNDTIPKSVRTVYYSQKYGIVAYELCSGAVFEIQNIKASK